MNFRRQARGDRRQTAGDRDMGAVCRLSPVAYRLLSVLTPPRLRTILPSCLSTNIAVLPAARISSCSYGVRRRSPAQGVRAPRSNGGCRSRRGRWAAPGRRWTSPISVLPSTAGVAVAEAGAAATEPLAGAGGRGAEGPALRCRGRDREQRIRSSCRHPGPRSRRCAADPSCRARRRPVVGPFWAPRRQARSRRP